MAYAHRLTADTWLRTEQLLCLMRRTDWSAPMAALARGRLNDDAGRVFQDHRHSAVRSHAVTQGHAGSLHLQTRLTAAALGMALALLVACPAKPKLLRNPSR